MRRASLLVAAALLAGCLGGASEPVLGPEPVVDFLQAPARAEAGRPVDVEFRVRNAAGNATLWWGPSSDASRPYEYPERREVGRDGGLVTLALDPGTWHYRVEVPTEGEPFWSGERRLEVTPPEGDVVVRDAPSEAWAGEPTEVVVETRGVRGGTPVEAWVAWSVAGVDGASARAAGVAPGPLAVAVTFPQAGTATWRVVLAHAGGEVESGERRTVVREGWSVRVLAFSDPPEGEPAKVTWRVDGPAAGTVPTTLHWGPRSSGGDDPTYARATEPREATVGRDVLGVIPREGDAVIFFRASATVEGRTVWSSEHALRFR